MSPAGSLLGHSSVNRAWQTLFADQKFAPGLAQNRLGRVLHAACGPGLWNTVYFKGRSRT